MHARALFDGTMFEVRMEAVRLTAGSRLGQPVFEHQDALAIISLELGDGDAPAPP